MHLGCKSVESEGRVSRVNEGDGAGDDAVVICILCHDVKLAGWRGVGDPDVAGFDWGRGAWVSPTLRVAMGGLARHTGCHGQATRLSYDP